MADKNNKFHDNAPGAFYVDKECINCDACILVAENHFKTSEDASFTYVYKQPETEEEKEACEEALEACPVEAIGKDGLEESHQNQSKNVEQALFSKKPEEAEVKNHQNKSEDNIHSEKTPAPENTNEKTLSQEKAENLQVTPLLETREKTQEKVESSFEAQSPNAIEKTKPRGFLSKLF